MLMPIRIRQKGDFSKAEKYFKKLMDSDELQFLMKYGQKGVAALSLATPVDTGKTAASWTFDIVKEDGLIKLTFNNANIQNGINIAIILDIGHGTGNGGYVVGRNYIEPAIQPIFDEMAKNAWKEVYGG